MHKISSIATYTLASWLGSQQFLAFHNALLVCRHWHPPNTGHQLDALRSGLSQPRNTAALQSGSGGLLLAAASPRPLRTAAQVSLSLQTSTVCCTLLINRACTFQLSRPGSVPAVGCCTSRRVIAQPLPSAPWSTPSLARAQFAAPCLRW